MPVKPISSLVLVVLALLAGVIPSRADEASVKAKQFPLGHFYQSRKMPLAEKAKVLAKIDATLKQLNQEGYGLIAKGTVLEKIDPQVKTYDKLTILDGSGLIIIAHRVPNLYYRYPGTAGLNPNIYLIVKRARVNFPESYIRCGCVVEGDYLAYAHKFVDAIMEGLERGVNGGGRPPDALLR